MKRILVAILCAILMPAVAAAEPAPAAAKSGAKKKAPPDTHVSDGRKTIGLIPEIGGTFTVQQVGIMVFGNEKREESIESWGIDAAVSAQVSRTVKARFNVTPIWLSAAGKKALAEAPGSLFGDRDGHICNVLRQEARGQSFNYYVRVRPRETPYGNTNQFLGGLGIVHGQGLDIGSTYVHALFEMEVLDGANCSSLRREWPAPTENFLVMRVHGLSKEVEASWMPAKNTVAQDKRLKEAAWALVEKGLAETIPQLFASQ
jgi:hypothetical protein